MIIWIASYPKSGNTWIRALLTNYILKKTKNVLDDISNIKKFPKKEMFEGIVDKKFPEKDKLDLFKYFMYLFSMKHALAFVSCKSFKYLML